MLTQFWENLRPDTRMVYTIARGRRSKHLQNGGLGLLCALAFEVPLAEIATLAALILFCEVITAIGKQRLPETDEEIRPVHMLPMMLVCLLSCSTFMAVGGVMAQGGNAAAVICGITIAIGVLAHVSVYYGAFPIYSHLQIIPALSVVFFFLYDLSDNQLIAAPRWQWMISSGVLVLYIINLTDLRGQTRKIFMELNRARKKANTRLRELEYLARHDGLTGLLTRVAFDTALKSHATADGTHKQGAFLVIDLNGFKPINDSYTHEAGDLVLREISNRMRQHVNQDDLISRFGGDEFVIAMPLETEAKRAMARAQAIMEDVKRPIPWRGGQLSVSCAIGVALPGPGGSDLQSLVSAADLAMYHGKSIHSESPVLFDEETFSARPTLQDRARLLAAIEANEIGPFYQPKIDMRNNRIVGFEALARWRRSTSELLTPAQFIPMIDDLGLQNKLAQHMIEAVFQDLGDWIDQGLDPGQVSINLPEIVLANSGACQKLIDNCARMPELRGHITLEITEDVFFSRCGSHIRDTIASLRENGIRVSLDDFGTGFASFQHLRELAFDEIKIDTSFVRALGQDKTAEVLVEGLLSIAAGLNIQTIAEGVEQKEHKARLLNIGCHIAQVFLWSPAIPKGEATFQLEMQTATELHRATERSNAG